MRRKLTLEERKKLWESRYSSTIVKGQLKGLVDWDDRNFTGTIQSLEAMIKIWFDRIGGDPKDKPRFYEDLDTKYLSTMDHARILLSRNKEDKNGMLLHLGDDYGVLVPKEFLRIIGGEQRLTRFAARAIIKAMIDVAHNGHTYQIEALKDAIPFLEQQLELESK